MHLILTQHGAAPYNEEDIPELAPREWSIQSRRGSSTPIAMTSLEPLERARKRVWKNLTATEQNELRGICTIEDVWKVTVDIQENQAKRRELGNMNKIQPYLEGLKRYDDVIKVLISSNPGILALIWVGYIRCISAV